MTLTAEAWILGGAATNGESPALHREVIEIPGLSPHDVLVEPLYGTWEANMTHAVERQPIDVCDARNESQVVLGNTGVVRVLEVGSAVEHLRPGGTCMFFPGSDVDEFGYMVTAHAYDAPQTIGLLARRTKVKSHNLVPLPEDTRFSLQQWAVFSGRYMTAWSNWSVAYRCFRTQLSVDDVATPQVWGWGGGTTLAELELAQRFGCAATMISGSDINIRCVRASGIDVLDRRAFPDLAFDERRYTEDPDYRSAYQVSERCFLAEVSRRTGGEGVSIFVDYLGSPVVRATVKALSRLGVLTTAGWKLGMTTSFNRAIECIARHIHVHTHYARLSEARPAVDYAEANGWMPRLDAIVAYGFEDIPRLVADYASGRTGYFPVYQVNP